MANTGRIRYEEQDMNPNSPTFGQKRWSGYENNTGACPLPQVFYSQAKSGYTTKSNCPTDQIGSQVFYTVPAGYASSAISQQDADAQATTYYENTRQEYANANGTCSVSGLGQTVSIVTFTSTGGQTVSVRARRSDALGDLILSLAFTDNSFFTQYGSLTIPAGAQSVQQSVILDQPMQATKVEIIDANPPAYSY